MRGYRRGETPNPCIRCNGFFRFGRLPVRAPGRAARLATGHYARIVEHDGRLLLARAADSEKDQSYMLARLDPRVLDRISFPLGGQSKEETRRRPSAQVSQRPADGEPGGVLPRRRRLSRVPFAPGPEGRGGARRGRARTRPRNPRRLLALHTGTAQGPRRGGRVAGLRAPTVPGRNAVVVGARESLARRRFGRTVAFADADRVDVKPATGRRRFRAGWRRGRAGSTRCWTSPRMALLPARRPCSTTVTSWSARGGSCRLRHDVYDG